MVEKRTATYWHLVRELLYSVTQSTKSPWDSGSRVDNSQDRCWQSRDIHQLQSECQKSIQHGPSTISVINYGLCWNTRRQLDCPETKQSLTCTQGQLTKINRIISEPPTRHLLVWNAIQSIMHALCRQWRILFKIQDRHWKRDHPPFQSLC